MIVDYFRIGVKNISRRRLRSWLTMLGIVVGIASVIALIGLSNGLKEAITGQFGSISADILTIQASGVAFSGPPGTGVINPLDPDLIDKIESIPEVDFAAVRLIRGTKTEYNDRLDIGFLMSLPEGRKGKEILSILGIETQDGRMLRDGDAKSVVLGSNFMEDDNSYGKAVFPGDQILINDEHFNVIGIMESQGSFLIDNIMLMLEDPMKDLLDIGDEADLFIARVKDLDDIDKAKSSIEKLLRKERDVKEGEEDFSVDTAQAVVDSVNDVLGGVQAFIVIIAGISMIVGAIGIINTMFTAVIERTKEIGIMKSIGGQNKDIFFLFLVESGLLGTVGGGIGILIGTLGIILGTKILQSTLGTDVAPQINILLMVGALVASFILGAASGVIPALQAAKMNPVDALRA